MLKRDAEVGIEWRQDVPTLSADGPGGEGDVYRRLLEKLDEERKALGGKIFDILSKLTFNDKIVKLHPDLRGCCLA